MIQWNYLLQLLTVKHLLGVAREDTYQIKIRIDKININAEEISEVQATLVKLKEQKVQTST